MKLLSRQEADQLFRERHPHSVSIFIPTHVSGQEVNDGKDVIVFRNQLKEVRDKLEAVGLNQIEVARMTKPLEGLVDSPGFWRNQSNGLAVFLADGELREYRLPLRFEKRNFVGDAFYLKPLMPLFSSQGTFHILTLGLHDVHLYRAAQYDIEMLERETELPGRLEDIVGSDYEQKSLQFRTQRSGQATFHGHGAGKDDRKDELMKFFRAIDSAVSKALSSQQTPLVVACLDYMYPIYREANTYKQLLSQHIASNPADLSEKELHQAAWAIIKPVHEKAFSDTLDQFRQFHGTGKTSTNLQQILPAAEGGRVEAVFLLKDAEVWGEYRAEDNSVTVDGGPGNSSIPLTNLLAQQVFLQGGKVYLLDEEHMPDASAPVNALYRY